MARCRSSPKVDISSFLLLILITTTSLSAADQGGTFSSLFFRVGDENDNGPRFGHAGNELILSVPENVNESYVIATLKANDRDEGVNGAVQYPLINGSSDAFSVIDGELRVTAPEKLHDQHVFKLTVNATDVNRPGNDSYLDVKIFVVNNIYDFILPTKLPVATLADNCQFVIGELGKILGLRLTLVKVGEHTQVDSNDSDRSELVFQALAIDTNGTVHVNASEIGIKIAGSSENIASLFGYLASFWNSTDVSANSEYTVNSLAKILIAVACLLFVIMLVAVITACRLWKSCCRQTGNLSDEASLFRDNWSFGERASIKSSHVSGFHEHTETSEFTKNSQREFTKTDQSDFTRTSQPEKPLMTETHDKTFWSNVDTHSLGLNTVARREHARDQQMQKMQQLFQAVGSAMPESKHNLYPQLDTEELQGESPSNLNDKQDTNLQGLRSHAPEPANPGVTLIASSDPGPSKLTTRGRATSSVPPLYPQLGNEEHQGESPSNHRDKQNTNLLGLGSHAPEAAKPSAAIIQSSGLDVSKLHTQGSGTSRTSLFPSILSKKDGKRDFAASKEHERVQQASTPVLDSATPSVILPQVPNSPVTIQLPPFEDSSTSQMLSSTPHTRGDEQNVKPTHKSDQNDRPLRLTPVKTEPDDPSLPALHNARPGDLTQQVEGEAGTSQRSFPVDTQGLDSLRGDLQDEGVEEGLSTEDADTHF